MYSKTAHNHNKDVQTMGKRHATRFLSDAYCKGLVRGQVECCNLRANHRVGQIVVAERISTADFVSFPGKAYLALLEALDRDADRQVRPQKYVRTKPAPGTGARHLRESVPAEAYGHRPMQSEVWWLSPYMSLPCSGSSCQRACHTAAPSGMQLP